MENVFFRAKIYHGTLYAVLSSFVVEGLFEPPTTIIRKLIMLTDVMIYYTT